MSECGRIGCSGARDFRAVLEFYPAVEGYTGPPGRLEFELYVCTEHARDEGENERLCIYFLPLAATACIAAGKAMPDPDRSRIRWERIQ